jgi:thiol-disulfide isomerase/thioredoxin
MNQKLKELSTPKNAAIQNINILGDSVIQDISKANRGHAIYVDIWATWCGPCLKEFPYSKKLQQELKEVTFVYICIDSERKAFNNAIERYQVGGQHYFLNKIQSNALRKQLDIDGVPHYLLINRDGFIVNPKHELFPSLDYTKTEIEKLLAGVTQK